MDMQAVREELAQIEARKSELMGSFDEAVRTAQSERDSAQEAFRVAEERISVAEVALQEATAHRNALNV